MKKLIITLSIITAMFFTTNVKAQFLSFGVKGGLNLSDISIDLEHGMKAGYHAGLLGRLNLSEMFAIQPEVLFSTKGTKIDLKGDILGQTLDGGNIRFNMNYIDVPVKAVIDIMGIELQAGPYVSFLVSNPQYNIQGNKLLELLESLDIDIDKEKGALDKALFETLDYGITAGIGYNISNFFVSASYNYGLGKVANQEKPSDYIKLLNMKDAKNSVIRFSVGIRF